LKSPNANANTLLSFGFGGGRKLGVWFVTTLVVPIMEKKEKNDVIFTFFKKNPMYNFTQIKITHGTTRHIPTNNRNLGQNF